MIEYTLYDTRDFTEMYRELYGLSYPGIMWPLPSEARVIGLKGLGWRFLTLRRLDLKRQPKTSAPWGRLVQ